MESWKTLITLHNPNEAGLIKSKLESHNILCDIANSNSGYHMLIEVKVGSKDYEEGLNVLEEMGYNQFTNSTHSLEKTLRRYPFIKNIPYPLNLYLILAIGLCLLAVLILLSL